MNSNDIILKIKISKEEYEALKHIAKSQGFELPTYYLKALIKQVIEGQLQTTPAAPTGIPRDEIEALVKRIQRTITDLLNPYTAKIDEINRRLAELIELLEEQGPQQREEVQERQFERQPRYERGEQREYRGDRGFYRQEKYRYDRYTESRQKRHTAIERLREDGVIFEEESQWIKMPERFFQSLEREGAKILTLSSGRVAVDPRLWNEFKEKLSEIGIRDAEEAALMIEGSLGPGAAKLFRKLVREGKLVYDEEARRWVLLEE